MLDIPRPFEALSDVSNDSSHNGRDCDSQEIAVSERLSQPPSLFSGSTILSVSSVTTSSPGQTFVEGARDKSTSSFNKSRKKSKKHKDKEKSKDKERAREKEKGRKSHEERVSEPNKACEMSTGNLESSSIPHKSTGDCSTH